MESAEATLSRFLVMRISVIDVSSLLEALNKNVRGDEHIVAMTIVGDKYVIIIDRKLHDLPQQPPVE